MKRIISAGLCTAFILSLAGCARQDTTPSLTAADTTDTQMGRWVESRVDLGGEQLISYPTQLADGTIVLYTGKVGEDSIEDYTRRTSTDGTNWTSEPAAFDVGDAMVTWILVAPDGEQALITYDGENAGLVLQAPDGTKTVVEDDTVKQGINPNTAVFQGDKLDFVSNGGTVDFVQVSLTDGSVTTAALPQDLAYSLNSLTTVGNQLVYLSFDNNTGDIILNALDPATGASTELLNPVPNATSSSADRRRRRRGLLRLHGRHLPPGPRRHPAGAGRPCRGHSDEHFQQLSALSAAHGGGGLYGPALWRQRRKRRSLFLSL